MKHIFVVILSLMVQAVMAQNTAAPRDTVEHRIEYNVPGGEYLDGATGSDDGGIPDDEVFMYVDEMPEFKGNFLTFISDNFVMSNKIMTNGKTGSLYLSFIVNKDGTVSDVKTIAGKGLSPEQNAEAERVIRLSSGQWTPGKINGEPVRTIYKQTFVFTEDMFE